ncbi:MAG: 1-deoxy-D-xylulose-5-phosphate reductoisomerase [Pseudomonadota bacterium]
MKTISILGSTGSIGTTTLEVVRKHSDDFKVSALSANKNYELLARQANEFKPAILCIGGKELVEPLSRLLKYKPEIVFSEQGLINMVRNSGCGLVVNALVGAAGLLPTIEAVKNSIDVALANKETLVVGGELVKKLADKNKVRIIPVDSEHNAIFQCLKGSEKRKLIDITLTASGGPFLNYPVDKFSSITPEMALNHPTWDMGKKISIDSATMINKGLEIMEARWLFDIPVDMVDVVIHPQSIVHGMVEFSDGSIIAMLAPTSMSIPIIYSLYYPEHAPLAPVQPLNFKDKLTLEFMHPDETRFPGLKLAREVAKKGGSYPAVFNAANEVAVAAFLDKKIKFTDIVDVIRETTDKHEGVPNFDIEKIIDIDRKARLTTSEICNKRSSK